MNEELKKNVYRKSDGPWIFSLSFCSVLRETGFYFVCWKDMESNSKMALLLPFSPWLVLWYLSYSEIWKPLFVGPVCFTVMCLQLWSRMMLRSVSNLKGISGVAELQGTLRGTSFTEHVSQETCVCVVTEWFCICCVNVTLNDTSL